MSTLKKGVFGLIVVLATFAGFAHAQQCYTDQRAAYAVYNAIGADAQASIFPKSQVRGGRPERCSASGLLQANGPCVCFAAEGKQMGKNIVLIWTPVNSNTIIVSKRSGGVTVATQTYNGYAGSVFANSKNQDPCANLRGASLEACRTAQEATGGDIGAAVGTVIRAIPGLFGR